jgi:hypothetical protein
VKTTGELLEPAMRITDQADAEAWFRLVCAEVAAESGIELEEVERSIRAQLGYFAGYYDHETRRRVERLFRTTHPVFGAAGDSPPTAAEAYRAGVALGRRLLNER